MRLVPMLALLIRIEPSDRIATKSGSLRAYQRKTGWKNAAKAGGLSAAEADRLFAEADGHYAACKDAWGALIVGVGAHLLAALMQEVRPLLQRFRDYKREAALLDFDDLIYAARDLLRDHETVRVALSQRYRRVLVDEFQDTDPLQAEIFWRLCGEAPTPETPWQQRVLRPGALFLVGTPSRRSTVSEAPTCVRMSRRARRSPRNRATMCFRSQPTSARANRFWSS